MTSLAVLTPSYGPDLALCRELHRSVLACTGPDVHHHIVVPAGEVELFAPLAGPRCSVVSARSVLPRRFVSTGAVSRLAQRIPRMPTGARIAAVNARWPWPPVRGWILQQVVKLCMAAEIGTDVVLVADSDVEFIRPVSAALFRDGGRPLLYEDAEGVTADMGDHLRWHDVARRLLGLGPASAAPLPDYISPFLAWDRATLLGLQDRVASVTGRPFADSLAGQLHLSEAILYGTYARSFGAVTTTASSRSHDYWDEVPLDPAAAARFVGSVGADDVAVSISAKSSTPLAVRRAALAILRD